MGRKKYTPQKLKEGVLSYFNSISHIVQVYDYIPTDKVTPSGRPVLAPVEATDLNGNQMKVREYKQTPSIAGLSLYLGISKMTLENYYKDEDMKDTIEYARLMIEDYYAGELVRRGCIGAKFALANNFGWAGWKEKQEIELGDDTRKSISDMSLSDKMKVIAEAAKAAKQDNNEN